MKVAAELRKELKLESVMADKTMAEIQRDLAKILSNRRKKKRENNEEEFFSGLGL